MVDEPVANPAAAHAGQPGWSAPARSAVRRDTEHGDQLFAGQYGAAYRARLQLNTSQIYLEPFGPGEGTRAGVRVVADNGSSFTAQELFRKARVAQARHLSDVMPVAGVGSTGPGCSGASQRFTCGDPSADCMKTPPHIVGN